jgi:hypothetical protein
MIYRIEIHGELIEVPASVWFAYHHQREDVQTANEIRNVAIAVALVFFGVACLVGVVSRGQRAEIASLSAERDAALVEVMEYRKAISDGFCVSPSGGLGGNAPEGAQP